MHDHISPTIFIKFSRKIIIEISMFKFLNEKMLRVVINCVKINLVSVVNMFII